MKTLNYNNLKLTFAFALIAIMALATTPALALANDGAGPAPVDHQIVCMVNDAVMNKPQIPVKVGDKTYYGCCKMCVGKIQGDSAIRNSTDPLTGENVDKAAAYIIEGAQGAALYFANEANAKKFVAHKKN